MKIFLFLILIVNCSKPLVQPTADIMIHDSPPQDEVFYEELQKDTVVKDVFYRFETVFLLRATRLSKNFLQAYNQRAEKLRLPPHPFSEVLKEKDIGFLVSLYNPDTRGRDLSNADHWSVYLEVGDKKIRPKKIVFYGEQPRLKPFFPYITEWSREFIVFFDREEDGVPLKMTLSNREASVVLNWGGIVPS